MINEEKKGLETLSFKSLKKSEMLSFKLIKIILQKTKIGKSWFVNSKNLQNRSIATDMPLFIYFSNMKPRDLSLVAAKEYGIILRAINKTLLENSHLTKVEGSEHVSEIRIPEFFIKLKDTKSNFSFSINDVNVHKNYLNEPTNHFIVYLKPSSVIQYNGIEMQLVIEEVLSKLKHWVEIVNAYDEITWTEEDNITKAYEEEFYAEYDIVDEDADIKPFSSEQQKGLNIFVNQLLENLEAKKDEYPVEDIIEDVKAIKKDLPTSTKKKIIKSFAKAFAKMKKLGVEAFEDLVKDGMKDIMKEAVKIGMQVELVRQITGH